MTKPVRTFFTSVFHRKNELLDATQEYLEESRKEVAQILKQPRRKFVDEITKYHDQRLGFVE